MEESKSPQRDRAWGDLWGDERSGTKGWPDPATLRQMVRVGRLPFWDVGTDAVGTDDLGDNGFLWWQDLIIKELTDENPIVWAWAYSLQGGVMPTPDHHCLLCHAHLPHDTDFTDYDPYSGHNIGGVEKPLTDCLTCGIPWFLRMTSMILNAWYQHQADAPVDEPAEPAGTIPLSVCPGCGHERGDK
jgi:hypothetical protein